MYFYDTVILLVFFAIPFYFLSKLIFYKYSTGRSKYRKYIVTVSTVISSLFAAILVILFIFLSKSSVMGIFILVISLTVSYAVPIYSLLKYILNQWKIGKDMESRQSLAVFLTGICSPIAAILLFVVFEMISGCYI